MVTEPYYVLDCAYILCATSQLNLTKKPTSTLGIFVWQKAEESERLGILFQSDTCWWHALNEEKNE